MTLLFNIPEKLKEYFTLITEKNDKWLQYLDSEMKYYNGILYVGDDMLLLNIQELDNFVVEISNENYLNCLIYIKGDNITNSQLTNTIISIDGANINVPSSIISTDGLRGLKLRLDSSISGLLEVDIPKDGVLTGLNVQKQFYSQNMSITSNNILTEDNTSYLELEVNIPNPIASQSLSLSTYYASGGLQHTSNLILSKSESNTIRVKLTDKSVKWKLELSPHIVNQKVYVGKLISGNL